MPTPDPATASLPDDPALLRIDGPIATITLNRPGAFNSIDLSIAKKLEQLGARQALERARDDLACALDEVDEHGLFADLVVADLIGIEAGQESGLSLKLEPPTRSASFILYVTTVRRNHQAIWTAITTAA